MKSEYTYRLAIEKKKKKNHKLKVAPFPKLQVAASLVVIDP